MVLIIKRAWWTLLITFAILAAYITLFHTDWMIMPPSRSAAAIMSSATSESTAPGKCPADTSEGVYYDRGQYKDGSPACGFTYYNACPYSEAVSATDPECTKMQVEQQATVEDIKQTTAQVQVNPSAYPGK